MQRFNALAPDRRSAPAESTMAALARRRRTAVAGANRNAGPAVLPSAIATYDFNFAEAFGARPLYNVIHRTGFGR